MNILITGANGFVGRNLTATLEAVRDGKDRSRGLSAELTILPYTRVSTAEELAAYCKQADFVLHLAGVNRPERPEEFLEGNRDALGAVLSALEGAGNTCPVLLTSSIQADWDNPYGESKRAGEALLRDYGRRTGAKTLIYRLPNLFGKWCRPNYNSVIATFCHNIARDLPITVSDPAVELTLCYIDDVVDEFIRALLGRETAGADGFCTVPVTHTAALGEIAALLGRFHDQPKTLMMPEIPSGSFAKKLYSTYLSYLPAEAVCFPLKMNTDARGSFTELMKTANCGQFSVNISRPGITKGQHWHHSKWEFFMVVAGEGLIQQRDLRSGQVLEFRVSGREIQAVHMLPGYTHNIINLSEQTDLVTVMWANESFAPQRPDTYFEEV